jgi:DNA polymerase-3 subunit epsilon
MIDNVSGDVLDVRSPCSWVEDPGEPLTSEIQGLTGLTDADLAGHNFDDEEICEAFSPVDVIVAHNARFDRSFLSARFPDLHKPVACSLTEIDWPAFGFSGRSIGGLLCSAGHFQQQAHRAGPDAWALACLLMMRPGAGPSIAWHPLKRAQRATVRLYADRAPYELKDTLRAAGYRWDAPHRAWTIEGDPERCANEAAWLISLHPCIKPRAVPIDWLNRHSA